MIGPAEIEDMMSEYDDAQPAFGELTLSELSPASLAPRPRLRAAFCFSPASTGYAGFFSVPDPKLRLGLQYKFRPVRPEAVCIPPVIGRIRNQFVEQTTEISRYDIALI